MPPALVAESDTTASEELGLVALIGGDTDLNLRLQAVLQREGITSVFEAESVRALTARASTEALQAIVLVGGPSSAHWVDALTGLRSAFAEVPIVSILPDDWRREHGRALKAGADGLLKESQVESALVPTLRAVCSGLVCFPRRTASSARAEALSNREKQVLGMLVIGFTNAEIGRRLYLAESTVKSHVSSAYMKLGVRSRKDAAALILDPHDGLGTGILAISRPPLTGLEG